ncbi:hypothetical protein V496_02800 [Pseudogymnoascus sp. VKM F-4515 (FW-2607)]|nr:hypothetical protein V496_02800 [Pseudogymnoascus sp. VKM F-4515 (FW-2607)]
MFHAMPIGPIEAIVQVLRAYGLPECGRFSLGTLFRCLALILPHKLSARNCRPPHQGHKQLNHVTQLVHSSERWVPAVDANANGLRSSAKSSQCRSAELLSLRRRHHDHYLSLCGNTHEAIRGIEDESGLYPRKKLSIAVQHGEEDKVKLSRNVDVSSVNESLISTTLWIGEGRSDSEEDVAYCMLYDCSTASTMSWAAPDRASAPSA